MKQRNRKDWEFYTPRYITDAIRSVFKGIDVDPYATVDRSFHVATENNVYAETGKCGLEVLTDSLESTVFCNPPYVPKHMQELAHRAFTARRYGMNKVVCLVPAATGTKYGQEFLSAAEYIIMLPGRIRFDTPTGPSKHHAAFSSMLACYAPVGDVMKLRRILGGEVVNTTVMEPYGI